MIKKTEEIINMLNVVIKNAQIIKCDFEINDRVHHNYVLEKLNMAKNDLECLIEIAEAKREK